MAQNQNLVAFANNISVSVTGNVGISNTAPTDKLSINGTTYLGGNVSSSGIINASSYTVGSIVVANSTALNANGFSVNSTGGYFTGIINATSHNTGGGYGSASGGAVVNSTSIAIGNTTANVIITPNTVSVYGSNVGYMELPQNSQTAAYTTILSDSGKMIIHPSSDNNARTFTIANNSSVAYPLGTVLTFVNAANVLTIAINNDTMYASGYASNTGSRSVNAYGIATAIKVGSTSWIISGSNMS